MMKYKQQIKEYKEEIEKKYVRIEAENRTVKACQNILSESILSKQSHRTSYFEFLYEQTKFIKKKMVDFTRLYSYVSMDMVE
ncbi:MAG: hypothetical protein ACLR8Q_04230 [[Ruminococcus] lactaris]|uniref:hypothetical protein n=1 Tax=[Ruminococcus] lactaris TaxID=46228 RepID=UPI0039A03E43